MREKPDFVLFQGPLKFPFIEGVVVSFFRRCGICTALTIHDVLPHYPNPWSLREFKWYYQQFDRLIVHSESAKSEIRNIGVTRPILVVPHGVYDLFRLTSPARDCARSYFPGLSKEDFVVLFFGHLEPRKGLLELLETAKYMTNVKFLIAGSNDLARHGHRYTRALEEARKWGNVIVRDSRIPFEEVERFFAASNLVALPYREGTTSGVLKLAIAFGLPVVATRVGDLPAEMPVGAGVLIDSNEKTAASLADAIAKVRADEPSFCTAMQSASNRCGWEIIARAYYEYLIN